MSTIKLFNYKTEDCITVNSNKSVGIQKKNPIQDASNLYMAREMVDWTYPKRTYYIKHVSSQLYFCKSRFNRGFSLTDDKSVIASLNDPRCFIVLGNDSQFCICQTSEKSSAGQFKVICEEKGKLVTEKFEGNLDVIENDWMPDRKKSKYFWYTWSRKM